MTGTYKDEMDKVRAARMKLIANHPFWGDLAFSLPITFDDTLDPATASVSPTKLTFHPKFVAGLAAEEMVFVLAHEVFHLALMHCLRRGNRCPKKWNIACDIVDNYHLIANGIGKMPNCGIHDPNLYHRGGGKVEKIYDLLPDSDNYGIPGSGGANRGSMDVLCDVDPSDVAEAEANMRNKLHQAVQTAKKAGNLPGSIEEFVEQITTPKVTWQQHLRNFVMTTRGTERTYAKRNRRYAATEAILPGNYGEKAGQIGFAIDCSGSTSDEMVSQSGGEIGSIQEEIRPEKTHVLYFDTMVQRHEEFEPDEPVAVKAYGRGGTCFRTLFEYIEKNNIELESLIVATDLDCSDYGPEPPFPVLWLAEDGPYARACAQYVPWGQIVWYN